MHACWSVFCLEVFFLPSLTYTSLRATPVYNDNNIFRPVGGVITELDSNSLGHLGYKTENNITSD